MPSFQVTTPNARVNLRSDGVCEVPYSVTNASGGARRGIFSVAATDDKTSAWYSIKGAPAFDFAPAATQQVTVLVAAPKTAQPQDYSFHLVAAVSDNPNADFTDGPVVTYAVTPAPPPRAFPWWILIVAVVLIAIVGAVSYKLLHRTQNPWCGTSWTSTFGTVALSCQGETASGTYGLGTLSGTASAGKGDELTGTWQNTRTNETGPFRFTLSADGRQFSGVWSFPPNIVNFPWTGTRQ